MIILNNEQRKHFATTLRTIGIGVLATVFGKVVIGSGNIVLNLTNLEILALTVLSAALEFQALILLRGIANG